MKTTEGLFGFSTKKYRRKIQDPAYSYAQLAANIYKKRRAVMRATASAVTGVATAHCSCGLSLVGSLWAARDIAVEEQKRRLLEEEWKRRGQPPLPKRQVTDTLIPVVLSGLGGKAVHFSVDLAVSRSTKAAVAKATKDLPTDLNGHAVGASYSDVVEEEKLDALPDLAKEQTGDHEHNGAEHDAKNEKSD